MKFKAVGALIVSDDQLHLLSIISGRDIVRSLAGQGAGLLDEHFDSVMKKPDPASTPRDRLKFVMHKTTENCARYIPVLDGTMLCGIVRVGHVVKHRVDDLQIKNAVLHDTYAMHSTQNQNLL